MYSHTQGVIRHKIKEPNKNKNKNKNKSEKEDQKEIKKGLPPKNIHKNISNDNFIKFQWPLIL